MKRARITFCLILVAFAILFFSQGGKTNHVKVSIEKSNKYTFQEINEAINTVKKKFRTFNGCELTELWYSEKESDALIKDYMRYGRGSDNGVKPENVIVLLSNFNVDSSGGDGSFEPNSTQSNWSWTLIRDSKTDNWRVDDWGY